VTPLVLTVEEAAALLKCTEDTVRDRAADLRGIKFGRDWVFPAEAFFEALNERARASTKKPAPQRQVVAGRRVPPKLAGA
jgi:excisionase family DNA binding protein